VQHAGSQWKKDENSAYYTNSAINKQEFIFDISNIKLTYQYELKPIFDIYAIRENSPAAKAGLKIGDKIIKINNKSSNDLSLESITNIFQSEDKKPVKMTIERKGKELIFEFLLEKIL
jgi:C-terminal processing protease CtpA/Prc